MNGAERGATVGCSDLDSACMRLCPSEITCFSAAIPYAYQLLRQALRAATLQSKPKHFRSRLRFLVPPPPLVDYDMFEQLTKISIPCSTSRPDEQASREWSGTRCALKHDRFT